jgi:hypothetical protein
MTLIRKTEIHRGGAENRARKMVNRSDVTFDW